MIALQFIFFALAVSALYDKSDAVVQLNTYNFDKLVLGSQDVWMVEFYAPWCGHCKNLAPEYKKAAKSVKGVCSLGAIDCDQDVNKPLCGKYGVQGFPTLKIFPGDRTKSKKIAVDFQQERSAKAIANAVLDRLPSKYVNRIGKKMSMESLYNIKNDTLAKVLLFTDKPKTTPLYKSLSLKYKDRLVFAEISSSEKQLAEEFDITSFPTLLVLQIDGKGIEKFTGKFSSDVLVKFLNRFAKAKESKADDDQPKAKKSDEVVEEPFDPKIPFLGSQVDYERECVGKTAKVPSSLCLIVFLPPVEKEWEESITQNQDFVNTLTALKEDIHTLKSSKQFPKVEIMWTFGHTEHVQLNILNKFGLSSDLPSAFVLNPGKKVYKPFIGGFEQQQLRDWIVKDLTGSRTKVYNYQFEVDFGVDVHANEIDEGSCGSDDQDGCAAIKDPLEAAAQKAAQGEQEGLQHEEL